MGLHKDWRYVCPVNEDIPGKVTSTDERKKWQKQLEKVDWRAVQTKRLHKVLAHNNGSTQVNKVEGKLRKGNNEVIRKTQHRKQSIRRVLGEIDATVVVWNQPIPSWNVQLEIKLDTDVRKKGTSS